MKKKLRIKIIKLLPNVNETVKIQSVSRNESIDKVKRIKVENNSIVGSISLKGGIIDDISFKNHKQNLEDKENIVFLNPQETDDGFFVETGWTSIGNKIKVPSIIQIGMLLETTCLAQTNLLLCSGKMEKVLFLKK